MVIFFFFYVVLCGSAKSCPCLSGCSLLPVDRVLAQPRLVAGIEAGHAFAQKASGGERCMEYRIVHPDYVAVWYIYC